jgi:hypothetical protein
MPTCSPTGRHMRGVAVVLRRQVAHGSKRKWAWSLANRQPRECGVSKGQASDDGPSPISLKLNFSLPAGSCKLTKQPFLNSKIYHILWGNRIDKKKQLSFFDKFKFQIDLNYKFRK